MGSSFIDIFDPHRNKLFFTFGSLTLKKLQIYTSCSEWFSNESLNFVHELREMFPEIKSGSGWSNNVDA
jgi:hypothetical protein